MNLELPENNNKLKKKQLIIYVVVAFICIISLIIAFYIQFYARIDIGRLIGISPEGEFGNKTEEQTELLKSEFNKVFNNTIENDDGQNNNKKENEQEDLVYTQYEKKESKINSYDLETHIPHINVKNEIINKYNKEIEEIFVNKTKNILESENKNIIYNIDYAANVQDGILSVMVKSNLKEGANAQKVIIQTYNYDLRNNKEVTLEEVLKIEQLNKNDIQERIKKQIQEEQEKVESLKQVGYNIYNRDITNNMYELKNSTEFYLTDNTLYIIYAYGNTTSTSEMDLIII